MKKKFAIAGCGFLGGIVAEAYVKGLLPDYELVGVTSRTLESAVKLSVLADCAVCPDTAALLAGNRRGDGLRRVGAGEC